MKLCPQCEFIYEDEQSLCDMDGEVLVYDTRVGVFPGTVPPAIVASPTKSGRRMIVVPVVAGLVLSSLLFLAFRASSPLLYSKVASLIRKSKAPETGRPQQIPPPPDNFPSQPRNPSQSVVNPEVASESVNTRADELNDKRASESAQSQRVSKRTDRAPKVSDNRLMIARDLPPLPQLTPLPRLPPPRRLPVAQPEARMPGSTSPPRVTIQRALIVEVKPATGKTKKRSGMGGFFKKTARIY